MLHVGDPAASQPVDLCAAGLRVDRRAFDTTPAEGRSALETAADMRLDNGDELRGRLKLPAGCTDEQLIAAAYEAWGEALPQHLLGEFALAIWDPRRRRLFAARDHFGVRPFFYRCGRAGFAFSTRLRDLTDGADPLNERRVADHLAGRISDLHSTVYEPIRRLPPGHVLSWDGGDPVIRPYYALEVAEPPRGDVVEIFLETLESAVASRLGGGRAGCLLSGGLDSSAVTALATRSSGGGPDLPVFSVVFDDTPRWSERPYIEAVGRHAGVRPRYVHADRHRPLSAFGDMLDEQGGLFLAPGLALMRDVHARARAEGVGALLDGHGGDEVVSQGRGRLVDLARAQRWRTLWRELSGGGADAEAVRTFAWLLSRHGPGSRLLRRPAPAAPGPPHADLLTDAVRDRLLTESGTADRPSRPAPPSAEQTVHLRTLESPGQAYAFEVLFQAARAQGVELRFPLWDKRLVELCLSLPGEHKLRDGYGRYILRQAAAGVLPDEVRWRRDKLDFTPHLVSGMLRDAGLIKDVLADADSALGAYVRLDQARRLFARVAERRERTSFADALALWRVTSLGLWLQGRDEVIRNRRGVPA